MQIGYSTQSNRSDFKQFTTSLTPGNIYVEARQAVAPIVFTLKKDGVQVVSRTENGAPYDMMGGSSTGATPYSAQSGSYELTVKDAAGTQVIIFTVGTITPPPVYGCTDPTATNYNPNATVDDGSCTYTQPTKPQVVVNVTADPTQVDLVIKVNGVVK